MRCPDRRLGFMLGFLSFLNVYKCRYQLNLKRESTNPSILLSELEENCACLFHVSFLFAACLFHLFPHPPDASKMVSINPAAPDGHVCLLPSSQCLR